MSVASVTFRRTLGQCFCRTSIAFAIAGFFCLASALFVRNLTANEGSTLGLAAILILSLAQALPVLAAFLAMDALSDERRSGRLDLFLSIAVKERTLVLGKFLGIWTVLLLAAALAACVLLACLHVFAPAALASLTAGTLCSGFLLLAAQGAIWSAVSLMTSAFTRHGAAAACSALALLVAVPRGLWAAWMAFAPAGRTVVGEFIADARAVDFASGTISLSALLTCVILTVLALFVASKATAWYRLVGRGARLTRLSTVVAVLFSFVFAALAVMLVRRLDVNLDLSPEDRVVSPRLNRLLADAGGEIDVTCFISRHDPNFRAVGRAIRILRRAGEATAGVRVNVRYVDPQWDLGPAERLVAHGVASGSVVFEKGRRLAVLPLADGLNDRTISASLQRVVMPPQRRDVCWTTGHGEHSFDDYGPLGMSDVARELVRTGYRNRTIELKDGATVPAECALVVVAGAREDFSRVELGQLDGYLRRGGRLLVLLRESGQGGVVPMLPQWGLLPSVVSLSGVATLTASDVIVSDFSAHPIGAPLAGSRIVLEKPVAFTPSTAVEGGTGADRIEFSPVASVGNFAVVAASERGTGAGRDLSIRPTRVVVIGDSTFAVNGQLAQRANANLDFFLNSVAYLSGTDVSGERGTNRAVFVSGMDRKALRRYSALVVGAVPLVLFVVLTLVFARRKRGA